MPKEWTDDEVQAEIREAVQIVREDRIDKLLRSKLGNTDNPPPSGNNPPPPGGNTDPPKAKKGLFWGEQSNVND